LATFLAVVPKKLPVTHHASRIGDYDYRPAREVAEGNENTEVRSVIDVDFLGHIFEQSITDLERLCLSLETTGRASVPASPNLSETPASQGSRGRSPSLEESPTDLVIYRSRLNARINRNFEVFSPAGFLAAITQHIPDKGAHMVR